MIDSISVTPRPGAEMLQWEGKTHPAAFDVPTLHTLEHHGTDETTEPSNRLIHGDNLDVLAHLAAEELRGQVRLIYIDPPFDSSGTYRRRLQLRGAQRTPLGDQIQYRDLWSGDEYLQFMYERCLLLRELLAADGSLWLHCDYRQAHRLRLLLEELFGAENYLNTVVWRSQVARGAKVNAFYFPYSTHYIHIFAKQRRAPTVWHAQKRKIGLTRRQARAQFMEDEAGFFRTSDPGTYSFEKLKELHQEGRLYAPFQGEILIDAENRRVIASNGGNIGVKYYVTALGKDRFQVERAVDNFWDDIPGLGTTPSEDVGYPTQKTALLLERVIASATNPGDLVLDCFMGSGTTMAVAQQMGRRWIGCDLNYGSIQTVRRRLQRMLTAGDPGFCIERAGAASLHAPVGAGEVELQWRRQGSKPVMLGVEVHSYHSTEIEQRLDSALARAVASDWRTQIDAIEIDPAYDGACFRPTVVDIPKGRKELVRGRYEITAVEAPTVVAVRLTDVLGAETTVETRIDA